MKAQLTTANTYASGDRIMARFELSNDADQDQYVLKWFTPLEGLQSDCLNVTLDGGTKVPYDGPLGKRATPTPGDFILVPAGQSVAVDFDVSEAYAVSRPGHYKIDLKSQAHSIPAPKQKVRIEHILTSPEAAKMMMVPRHLSCGPTAFDVQPANPARLTRGERAREAEMAAREKFVKTPEVPPSANALAAGLKDPTFTGGSASQQASAKQAHKDGYQLVLDTLASMVNDDQYITWFGAFDQTRFDTVKSHYTSIRTRMETTTFIYNLTGTGCQNNWYAYTYINSGVIWLCSIFWNCPATGTNSKAGTIVHEHSHCDAGTDDIAYGQPDAMALAIDDPASAIKNADNHEYYSKG